MMRFTSKFGLLVLALALFSACGQKSADLQESAQSPDKTLYENGMKYFEKSYYIKARLAFQTLINTYPDSEYTPASFLAIADSYYKEGGTENLLQAEAQYKDFIIFYPNHEMADDAQLKVAAINVRLMKPSDRDPTYARKAEVEFKKFLENFPDSELAPTAQEFLREVQENRAVRYSGRRQLLPGTEELSGLGEPVQGSLWTTIRISATPTRPCISLGFSLESVGRIEEASVYYGQGCRASILSAGSPTKRVSGSSFWKRIFRQSTRSWPRKTREIGARSTSRSLLRCAMCGRLSPAAKILTKWRAGGPRNERRPSRRLEGQASRGPPHRHPQLRHRSDGTRGDSRIANGNSFAR